MRSRKLARRYALALGELSHEQGVLEETEQELRAVLEAAKGEAGFSRVLESENISPDEKMRIIREAFGNSLSRLTLNFILLVISKRRESSLLDMIEEFLAYADEKRGVVEVELTTAESLDAKQAEQISQRLSQVLSKEVRLTVKHDQTLIGGVVARVGDMVMDGSVKSRLGRLEQELRRAQLN